MTLGLSGGGVRGRQRPLCPVGVNINLARLMVPIMSVSGFVVRERAEFSVMDAKADWDELIWKDLLWKT